MRISSPMPIAFDRSHVSENYYGAGVGHEGGMQVVARTVTSVRQILPRLVGTCGQFMQFLSSHLTQQRNSAS